MRSFRQSALKTVLGLSCAALISLTTACNDDDSKDNAAGTAPTTPAAVPSTRTTPSAPGTAGAAGGSAAVPPTGGARTGTSSAVGGGTGGTGGGGGSARQCKDDDLTYSVTTESVAGGYFLVKATANSGVTCVLPETHPVVTFGSKAQASPAEHSVGPKLTLSGGSSAYAGINPKTTNDNNEILFDSFHIGLTDGGTGVKLTPRGGDTGIDKPIVTNWHTDKAEAAPGDGGGH
ncbi:hypothetical protein ACFZBU_12650 [Embleya sp. NPDC008237]|uniref:hypothetical protein n=1 Tax=Embleya sp. NPDC008237 TaxID=3363978 RepID=UPI0036E8A061